MGTDTKNKGNGAVKALTDAGIIAEELPAMDWAPAVLQTLAEKLEGRLLAFWPRRTEVRVSTDPETAGEERLVTICSVWDITEDAVSCVDNAAPIGWVVAREQLEKCTPQSPWLMGRVGKKNRAVVINPPRPEEVSRINGRLKAVAQLLPMVMEEERAKLAAAEPTPTTADEPI